MARGQKAGAYGGEQRSLYSIGIAPHKAHEVAPPQRTPGTGTLQAPNAYPEEMESNNN